MHAAQTVYTPTHQCFDGITREIIAANVRPTWVDAFVCTSRLEPNMIEKIFMLMREANDAHPEFSDIWVNVLCMSTVQATRS